MARRTRGTGEVYREEGRLWAFRWRENGQRRYSGGHPTKEIADRALARVKGRLALNRADLPFDPKSVPRLSVLAEDFLERRKATHQAWAEDGYRWEKHVEPHFGRLRPDEVDTARIRAFVELKLGELAPGTIRICIALLSSLFVDLVERRLADKNPCRGLPRSVMRLMRSDHDARTTPFVEKMADVRRIYLALAEPLNIAYALGALGGLRTGEVFALQWPQVDLAARRIHVRESVKGPLKDKESRIVPILDALLPILEAWKLKSGGEGRLIPPLRCDGAKVDDKHTPGRRLRAALVKLGLARPGFGQPSPDGERQKLWYWCTRHTFASQWVMAGGSIEKLSTILGHYSVQLTWQHYVHLRPELFTATDHRVLSLDMAASGQPVAVLSVNGQPLASEKGQR